MIWEVLRTISILILIIFGIWTIYLIYRSIRIFPKSRRLYKSSFNSIWKSLTASITIIIFFAISFSIISGTITSIDRLGRSIDELTIENNLHQGFIETDSITFKGNYLKDDIKRIENQSKTNDEESLEYLYSYYDFNLSIPLLLGFLYLNKGISTITFDDTFKNIEWKYELSYFVTRENVSWGYNYISLNDHKMLYMINDFLNGELKPIEDYRLSNYDENIFGQTAFDSANSSKSIINDYQIVDSLNDEGANALLNYSDNPNYDVIVGIGADWADQNNYEVGDIITLPQELGTDIKAKIGLTFRTPEYMYPSFTLSKVIPDSNEQTYVLMNSEDYLTYFGGLTDSKISIGFNNLYNDINSWRDYNSGFINKRLNEYISQVNTTLFVIFENAKVYKYNDVKSYESIGVAAVFLQLRLMILISIVLLIIFLLITLSILIILIKKRVTLNRKELGTLKAQGWSYTNIALSFISYSFFIVIFGGIFAFLLGFFVQGIWIKSWGRSFLIGYGNPIASWFSIIIIFIIPILLLFSISYFITKRILKEPAIELINNIQYNKPNILVRGFSKISHYFNSFYLTYQTKNVLRGIGKSTVLFSAVFLSVILSSLSLSTINLINKTVVEVVNTVRFENAISLDQTAKDANMVNMDASDFNTKYTNYYMLQDEIAYSEVKNLNFDQVKNLANDVLTIDDITKEARAIQFDSYFGNYIKTQTFNSVNTIIPWQAFVIMQVGIDKVLAGEGGIGEWANNPLPTSNISFNDYQNILFNYQDYVNINSDISNETGEDLILPNITFNTIFYDNDNLFPYYLDTITNSKYLDENTNNEIKSLFDLSFESTNSTLVENVVSLNGEEFILKNGTPTETVDSYLNSLNVYNNSINGDEPYLYSYYQESSRNEIQIEGYEEAYEVTFTKYQRSDYIKDTSYNGQWLSIANSINNVENTINFDASKISRLENYEAKNVEIKYKDQLTGIESVENVKTIPIAIDSYNANRLGLEENQIVKTTYYDLEEQLNNNLELNGVTGGVAFEVVDIFDYPLPIGAITLSEYIFGVYENDISINTLIQANSKQQSYYSFTSSKYEEGTTLQNDISSTRKIYRSVMSKDVFTDQINVITSTFIFIIIVFIFFTFLIAITLIIISIKEIIDSSIQEISILKANGIRNGKAVRLVLVPYIIIMGIALLIGALLNVIFLYYMSILLSSGIGIFHISLQLYLWQWAVIFGINILIFVIMWISSYYSLARRNTIDEL